MSNQKKCLIRLKQIGKKIQKACERLNLKIKWRDKGGCSCSTNKRKALLQENKTSQRYPGSKEEEKFRGNSTDKSYLCR